MQQRKTMETNIKNQAFQRLAEPRVNLILNRLRILGHLSNTAAYEFSEGEIELIFSTIEGALEECKQRFRPEEKPARKQFSFQVA